MLCSRVASVVNNELRLFYYSANKKPVVNKTHSASLCLLNSSIKSGIGKSLTRIFVRYDTFTLKFRSWKLTPQISALRTRIIFGFPARILDWNRRSPPAVPNEPKIYFINYYRNLISTMKSSKFSIPSSWR